MADDFDSDWGDDPFSGDMDFDSDFDSPSKKGFLRSFTTGFLNGLVNKTVGDTDAKIDTLKMVLPRTYLGAFSVISDLRRKRDEFLQEIKGTSYEAVKDLQYLAGRAAAKLGKSGPNRIADGFTEFSKNDFSDWERRGSDYSGDTAVGLSDATDDEVKDALSNADANSILEREATIGAAGTITDMMANVGGRTMARLNAMGSTTIRTNQLLEQVVDYQRRVQARNDSLKLNIMTRSYLTDAKFYKFVEASNHRIVAELKKISESSAKSDYEKTTHSQAVRKSVRESVFSSVKSKIGGIAGFIDEKFGKAAQGEFGRDASEVTSALRMAAEMTEGMDINLGDMLGNAAAGIFINNLPRMAKSGRAQKYLAQFKASFPALAKWGDDAVARITDLGNVASYALTNAEGLTNTMAKYYQGGNNWNEVDTYEEYVDTLPEGQEPMHKLDWTLLNNARKIGNKAISGVFDNMTKANGTRYNLARRTLDDGFEQALWNNRSDRTLNEILPQWLSQIHLSMEKFRTGKDDLRASTYDYVKGKLVSHDQQQSAVVNHVLNKSQFSTQANMAIGLADSLDGGNALSPQAKKELAFRLAQDTDAELGINPYNYLHTDKEHGVAAEIAKEIKDMIQAQFGITDEHIEKFEKGTDVDRFKMLNYLPTEAGRAKIAELAPTAQTLAAFVPDVTNRLDMYKASGYYEPLKEAGIIKSEDGWDTVNKGMLDSTLRAFIEDPTRQTAPFVPDTAALPSRPFGGPGNPPLPPVPPTPAPPGFAWPAMPKFEWPALPKFPAWKALPKFPAWPAFPKLPAWPAFPALPVPKATPPAPGPSLGPTPPPAPKPLPGPGPAPTPAGPETVKLEGMEDLTKSLSGLDELQATMERLGKSFSGYRPPEAAPAVDLVPITTGMDNLIQRVDSLLLLANTRNQTLTDILMRQPPQTKPVSEGDEKEMNREKKGILERLKATSFREVFNNGVDKILDNQPLILGGLLGGLAGMAVYNPKSAALLAGGAAVAATYMKMKSLSTARTAKSTEDLYEEGSTTPVLEANKLVKGDYLDMTSGFIIDSWDKISGSVKDISNDTVIGARRLAGKLFNQENKEVFISGLSKLRDTMLKAYNWMDPFARVKRWGSALKTRFYQMDVYKEGEDSPTLVGKRFASGAYCKKTESGELVAISGWNEIDGPVYTPEGDIIITQEEYDRGLRTSMGVSVNKLQDGSKKLGRLGLDFLNKVKDKTVPMLGGAYDKSKAALTVNYAPIVNAVDRIYHLLLKHWGYQQEQPTELPEPNAEAPPQPTPQSGPKTIEDAVASVKAKEKEQQEEVVDPQAPMPKRPTIKPKSKLETAVDAVKDKLSDAKPKDRLNSLSDKKTKAKEKKKEDSEDALIHIAKNFGWGEKKDDKKKPTGLFGLLSSGFGLIASGMWGITKFFTRNLLGGFRTLFSFGSLGLKVLPALATGIAAIAKGIFTLIKTRSLAQAGGSVIDSIRGRRTPRGPRPPRTSGSRMGRGAKIGGAGLAVGLASDYLVDAGVVDQGSVTDTLMNVAGTAGTIWGAAEMGIGVAGAMGITGASITGAIGTAAAAVAGSSTAGFIASGSIAMAGLLLNPITLGVLAAGAVGYGIYKFVTRGEGKQIELRMAQYGVPDVDSDLAKKILKAEEMLADHVVIGNGRASFSKNSPINEVIQMFVNDPKNPKEVGDVFTWFNGRFKPVLLTYMACLDTVKIKSLKEYDEAKTQDVYKVANQTNQALNGLQPYPYSIVAKIDATTPLLGEKATRIRVNNLLEELKSYVDRKTPSKDLESISTPRYQSKEALEKEKLTLQKKLEDKSNFGEGTRRIWGVDKANARLKELDVELGRLNTTYKAGAVVTQIYIKDLMPDDKAMDLMTAIRVACYGNDEDLSWRVEAVMKLERHCEALFADSGETMEFTGQIGDLFNLFKDSFRLDKGDADDWCLWFRDRFLPVLTNYMTTMKNYRRGRPAVVWKTLSATARYEISKALVETKGKGTLWFDFSIWNVRASPFKGSASPDKPEKVDRMLKLLGEASTSAKLKDPEAEAGKTNVQTWAKTVSPHKVGGDFQSEAANVDDISKAKTRRDVGLNGQFGTNGTSSGSIYGQGGVYNTPQNKYGFTPLGGDTDTSHLDMSGVKAQEGNDKGVKVPKKLAEQIIIREMLKQGFTDPREIAEVLALTNYESGGYQATTESLKYSDPKRLVSMFKEVKNVNQARMLIEQGEVAIANTVYGGGKGAGMGNREPGDGWKYRGRGFIQLTGKNNYAKTGQELGIDLVNKPELASTDPNVMAAVAVNFFKNSKLMRSISQTGNFGEAAKGLNPGGELPGMPKRYQLYLKYLEDLQKGELSTTTGTTEDPAAVETQTATGMYGGSSSATPPASGGGTAGSAAPSGGASPPMMGNPNLPSLANSPSGGSASGNYGTPAPAGGGEYGSNPESGPMGSGKLLFDSNSSGSSGLRLKSGESVAGGDAHPGLKRLCQVIQELVPGFKVFTALNDAYHVNKGSKGGHPKGLAADFTLTNGIQGSDRATAAVNDILRQAGMQPGTEFLVINEYRKKTAIGTGGHIHVGFKTPAAAQKFLAHAGTNEDPRSDTTGGGGVEPTEPPNRAQPTPPPGMGPEVESEEGGTASPAGQRSGPSAAPRQSDMPTSSAPAPQQSTQAPYQGPVAVPPPAPVAVPKAAPPPPDNSAVVAEAMKNLATAMQSSGGDQAVLLKAILDQMVLLNKKGNAPQGVKVN